MSSISDATIRAGASSQSFDRGSSYFRSGAVHDIEKRGDLISGRVEGSDYEPYRVAVTVGEDGQVASASCTCPYDWGGYCKHVVAVLLTVVHNQESIAVRPDLNTLLADLSVPQLRRIILALAEGRPELSEAVEQEVAWLRMEPSAGTSSGSTSPVAVDQTGIKRDPQRPAGGSQYGWRLPRPLLGRRCRVDLL